MATRAKGAEGRQLIVPKGYRPRLTLLETEAAIKFIKDRFQNGLSRALQLSRVSAPVVVSKQSGINDYLNGTEHPVAVHVRHARIDAEIVQSLAKWKRAALADYGIGAGRGLYTDMNALRQDEHLDNLHSVYVDQWDWERVMRPGERDIAFLARVVRGIYGVIRGTERAVCRRYPKLGAPQLPRHIQFVHSEELRELFPKLPPRAREDAICRELGAVFVVGIGSKLRDGIKHDDRAPDYDDWSTEIAPGFRGLNGDILVWNPVLGRAFELSSMGIRVNAAALRRQLKLKGVKGTSPYHRRLLRGELPQTIGGGIGQSRLCMLFLRKAHIGEVQSSVWPAAMVERCRRARIALL